MEVAVIGWHSTGKPEMKSNKCIKFSRCTSWAEIRSEHKVKAIKFGHYLEQQRSQPVRITQLTDSKTTHCSVRKRAQPERLTKAFSIENKTGLIQNDNVNNKSEQKKLMKLHLGSNNTQSHSKSTRKHTISHPNECDLKVRRNLNFNLVSPKQRIEENTTSTTCLNVQEKKSISSNSSIKCNPKSFLLPPNTIRRMYSRQYSKKMSLSTVSRENDNTIRNTLHKSIVNEMGTHVQKNTTLIDNKIQGQKHHSAYQNNSSKATNADNLKDICHELENVILTEKSKILANGNIEDFSGEDRLCIDKNTIVSLKYCLEDLLNVFQDNAFKVELLLTHIKKILHAGTNSMEEHAHPINTNGEIIKETSRTYEEQKVKENNMNTLIRKSVVDNNVVRNQIADELSEEGKENNTPQKLEIKLEDIDCVKSSKFSPKLLQMTIPNYANCSESVLEDYINLKSGINFLETPHSTKLKPHMQKSKNVLSNVPKDRSYLSSKILTELQNLYDD